jgi:polysaccharide pyruvyl transferase WcaK-like protein
MRILIEPGTYSHHNAGDIAALLVAAARIEEEWPAARTVMFTAAPDRLRDFAPRVVPYSTQLRKDILTACSPNGGSPRGVPPGALLRWRLRRHLHWRPLLTALPSVTLRMVSRRLAPHRRSIPPAGVAPGSPAKEELRETFRSFSLFAVSGAGSLCDSFLPHAWSILQLLEVATSANVPTALFSQGLGPIQNRALRSKAESVLPQVDVIAVRERRRGPALLREFGVSPERIHITGDDAIELAYRRRAQTAGDCLGINLRAADYSGVDRKLASLVIGAVAEFAKAHGLKPLPIPISFADRESDLRTICDALGAPAPASCPQGAEPAAAIGLAGRCRMVVTGSYHGAVFALSQGIPAVALTNSQYYENKFLGLADMFGEGCQVIDLSRPNFPHRLLAVLQETLAAADGVRDPLLRSACEQIAASRAAYRKVFDLVSGRRA